MDDTRTRNRLGAATFVMVVIGAVFAIFPATAPLCRDNAYSFSQHRSGTCSGHGGVSRWL